MKKLYIFRGLPGSGKSTLAHKMAPMVIEMDQFRVNDRNEYLFNSDDNARVHKKSVQLLAGCMHLGMPLLAVANTNVRLWHMKDYIDTALDNGYDVEVVTCRRMFGSTHNVPDEAMRGMERSFEELDDRAARILGISAYYDADYKEGEKQ